MKRVVLALIFALLVAGLSAQSSKKGLAFDLGAEPDKSGTLTYGMLQYGWTDNTASRIDLRYSTATETGDDIEGYANAVETTKTHTFEADVLPLVRYFGESNAFSVSLGASYQFTREKYFAGMFDANGLMLDEGDEGKYFTREYKRDVHIFAPRLGFTAELPFARYFCFNLEAFVHPFYCLYLSQDMAYHSDQAVFDYSGDNSLFRVSSPYFSTKMTLDMFDYARLLGLFTYQRLDFQQMDWTDDFEGLEGKDDVQTMMKLRFGVELLSKKGGKARVRGGIYREIEWYASTYRDEKETESRWVVSFGTEL